MKIGIYVRVSASDQNTNMQKDELYSYCKGRGWDNVELYEDLAISGMKSNRPALNRLMDDAHKRKIQVVLIWKLDRLFRSLKDLLNTLAILEELGVEFISYKENIDLSTVAGKLMLNIIGTFAQFERDMIVERVRSGIAAAHARGVKFGKKRYKIDIEAMRDLRKSGKTFQAIADIYSLSPSGVMKMLRRG